MYKPHYSIRPPESDTIIWHYFSLAKFLSMLNNQSLYFTRADRFLDSHEGRLSNKDTQFLDKVIPNLSDKISDELMGHFYINCWTINKNELYLMWDTYSSLEEGVAIQSTVENLIDSLDSTDKREIVISKVSYMDYHDQYTFDKTDGDANLYAPYFCKRLYFQQENELRLVYYDYEKKENIYGLLFKVSLDTLIDNVWVSPKASDWFRKLIDKELEIHGIKRLTNKSQI